MGGLQTQLQRVQSERNALQTRLKTSQAEVDSLQQLRLWYQQQLTMAQEARVRLQGEMANMQVCVSCSTSLFIYSMCTFLESCLLEAFRCKMAICVCAFICIFTFRLVR